MTSGIYVLGAVLLSSQLGLMAWIVRSLLENSVVTRELQHDVRRLEDAVWPPRREVVWRREPSDPAAG